MLLQANEVPDTLSARNNLAEAQVVASRNTTHESSAPAFVVHASELTQRGMTTLTEVLTSMAGVSVKDYGGIGGLKTVSLRNFGSAHTGICLDGIVLTNAQSGQVDISRYNLDNMASVGVDVAGSDDLLRSARLHSAVGTVTLVSQRPQLDSVATHLSAQVRAGSYMTWQPYLKVAQRLSRCWTSSAWASGTYSRSDYPFTYQNGKLLTTDRRKNSKVLSGAGEFNVYGELGKSGTLSIKAQGYGGSRGLPGSVVLYANNAKEHLWDAGALLAVQHHYRQGQWQIKSTANYNYAWNHYLNPNIIYKVPQEDRYHNHEAALSAVVQWMPLRCLAVSVAEDLTLAGLKTHFSSSQNSPPSDEGSGEAWGRLSSYTALSARFRILQSTPPLEGSGEVFSLTAGALLQSSWHYARVGEGAPNRCRLSPMVSMSYRLLRHADWRIRASFKETYRQPTFTDLYYLRTGNRNLRPERALQANLGTTYSARFGSHQLMLSADGYYNAVRDKITAVPTLWVWHMRNLGRVNMVGADLAARYQSAPLTRWLRLSASANYSYQWAVDVTNPAAKNYRHQIPYTPRHTGSAHLSLLTPWLTFTYQLTAASERYSLAQNLPAYCMAPYADHSLSLNHTFNLHRSALHVSAEALNLAGRNYEIIQYYPMPGRQWRATVKWSL